VHEGSNADSKLFRALLYAPLSQLRRLSRNLHTKQLIGNGAQASGTFGSGFKQIAMTRHRIRNSLLSATHGKCRKKSSGSQAGEALSKMFAADIRHI
jgi:hypothetical protein